MNARVEMPVLAIAASRAIGLPSPELASAIDALDDTLRSPDTTLDEIYDALQGTALTWSKDGQLTFSPERMALVAQLDGLIDIFGGREKVAALFRQACKHPPRTRLAC